MVRKIVVAGGRDFDDYEGMKRVLDRIKWDPGDEIVSGTAKGADTLGERYAEERGLKVSRFPADWSLGKKAGFIRNEVMAKYCTGGVVFWDGESHGSKNMIFLLNKYKKTCRVVNYTKIKGVM